MNGRQIKSIIVACLFAIAIAQRKECSAVLGNGGFETPSVASSMNGVSYNPVGADPWMFAGTSGISNNSPSNNGINYSGQTRGQFAFILLNGTISACVGASAGSYQWNFVTAPRANNPPNHVITATVTRSIDNTVIASRQFSSWASDAPSWMPRSVPVTIQADGAYILTFTGIFSSNTSAGSGTLIDEVTWSYQGTPDSSTTGRPTYPDNNSTSFTSQSSDKPTRPTNDFPTTTDRPTQPNTNNTIFTSDKPTRSLSTRDPTQSTTDYTQPDTNRTIFTSDSDTTDSDTTEKPTESMSTRDPNYNYTETSDASTSKGVFSSQSTSSVGVNFTTESFSKTNTQEMASSSFNLKVQLVLSVAVLALTICW